MPSNAYARYKILSCLEFLLYCSSRNLVCQRTRLLRLRRVTFVRPGSNAYTYLHHFIVQYVELPRTAATPAGSFRAELAAPGLPQHAHLLVIQLGSLLITHVQHRYPLPPVVYGDHAGYSHRAVRPVHHPRRLGNSDRQRDRGQHSGRSGLLLHRLVPCADRGGRR